MRQSEKRRPDRKCNEERDSTRARERKRYLNKSVYERDRRAQEKDRQTCGGSKPAALMFH